MAYRGNARRVPSVTGAVVPEPAFSRAQYENEILGRIYEDLAPHDPAGVLRHEWANARGAIARFDRGTVEVRVIDAQECPAADLAVVAAVSSVVRALAEGPLSGRDVGQDPDTEVLASILEATTLYGEQAVISDGNVLSVLGRSAGPLTAGQVWRVLLNRYPPDDPLGEFSPALEHILREGTLARRLVRAAGEAPSPLELRRVGEQLCGCLHDNRVFAAP